MLAQLGLTLHPVKTRVVYLGDGKEGIDFLGFHCHKVESWRQRGRRYLWQWPGRRAMREVRERIKEITSPRHRLPEAIKLIVAEVNQVLRGWGAYFRTGNSSRHFGQVDSYVRERLGLFLSKKTGRTGRRWESRSLGYFQALGVYQLAGTVSWYKATPKAVR